MADPALSDPHLPPEPTPGGGTPADGPNPPPTARARRGRALLEWVAIIAVTVVLVLVIKTFFVQAFFIPSGSMEPTLKPGDRVLVEKTGYTIHRGNIIVFKKPPTDNAPGITDLIKRVIGMPGDRISAHGGYVYINGHKLNEHWLPQVDQGVTTELRTQVVPKGTYFVLGDNRTNSDDSRFIGDISKKLVVGKAFLLIWPLNSITTF